MVQRSYIPWSVLFLCVYSAGFPMLVAGILWRNKPFMKQDQLLRAYGYGKRPDESTDLIWRTRLKYKELCECTRALPVLVCFYPQNRYGLIDPPTPTHTRHNTQNLIPITLLFSISVSLSLMISQSQKTTTTNRAKSTGCYGLSTES